jgi:hypothetical protein
MHNTHHYQAFMHEARQAIQTGTFEQYRSWFKQQLDGSGEEMPVPLQQAEDLKRAADSDSDGGSSKRPRWTSSP